MQAPQDDVLLREKRRERGALAERAVEGGLDQQAAEPGVDRQPEHPPARPGELVLSVPNVSVESALLRLFDGGAEIAAWPVTLRAEEG